MWRVWLRGKEGSCDFSLFLVDFFFLLGAFTRFYANFRFNGLLNYSDGLFLDSKVSADATESFAG